MWLPIVFRIPFHAWCMLFADDIVLLVESKRGVNTNLDIWHAALEAKGLGLRRSNTEYLWTDFSGENNNEYVVVCVRDDRVLKTDSFRYLSSITKKNNDIIEDVTHRTKAGWCRWSAASRVLWDKRVLLKLKDKFYRVAIKPTLLYDSECWPLRKAQEHRLKMIETCMLRWTYVHTMMDYISNDVFRALNVESISKKVSEGRLRWFGLVQQRQITLEGLTKFRLKRKMGRSTKDDVYWSTKFGHTLNLTGGMTLDWVLSSRALKLLSPEFRGHTGLGHIIYLYISSRQKKIEKVILISSKYPNWRADVIYMWLLRINDIFTNYLIQYYSIMI